MKTKQRLTKMETDYSHIEHGINKLFDKLDSQQERVDSRFRTIERIMYIGFGILLTVQFAISNGIIKVG